MLSSALNQFLVLGLIPGTGFQITFIEWLVLAEILLTAFLLRKKLPSAKAASFARHYWVYGRLYLSIKKGQQLTLPV